MRKKISSADICVFDISGNRHNVVAEAGWALGLGKTVILIKARNVNEQSSEDVPTDFADLTRLEVATGPELRQPQEVAKLETAVVNYVRKTYPPYFYLRSLWGLDSGAEHATIACASLTQGEAKIPLEDYLEHRMYADIDALILLRETLARLFPSLVVREVAAKDLSDLGHDWRNGHLIVLGGADINPIVREFAAESPIVYRYRNPPDPQEIGIYDRIAREFHKPIKHRASDKVTDFGFFLKRPLNRTKREKLIVLGGCRTWGVLGATRMFSVSSAYDQQAAGNARMVVESLGSDPSFVLVSETTGALKAITRPAHVKRKRLHALSSGQVFPTTTTGLPWDDTLIETGKS